MKGQFIQVLLISISLFVFLFLTRKGVTIVYIVLQQPITYFLEVTFKFRAFLHCIGILLPFVFNFRCDFTITRIFINSADFFGQRFTTSFSPCKLVFVRGWRHFAMVCKFINLWYLIGFLPQ